MTSSEFITPSDGSIVKNPSLDFLKEHFLIAGREFWNAGSGDGALYLNGAGTKPYILITFDCEHGFHLEYFEEDDRYLTLGDGTFDQTAEVYIGGDPVLYPAAFFISREAAWLSIQKFIKTGTRYDGVNWKSYRDIEWCNREE